MFNISNILIYNAQHSIKSENITSKSKFQTGLQFHPIFSNIIPFDHKNNYTQGRQAINLFELNCILERHLTSTSPSDVYSEYFGSSNELNERISLEHGSRDKNIMVPRDGNDGFIIVYLRTTRQLNILNFKIVLNNIIYYRARKLSGTLVVIF